MYSTKIMLSFIVNFKFLILCYFFLGLFAVDTQLIIHVKNKQHTQYNERGEEANTQFMLYALTHTLHLTLLCMCALF